MKRDESTHLNMAAAPSTTSDNDSSTSTIINNNNNRPNYYDPQNANNAHDSLTMSSGSFRPIVQHTRRLSVNIARSVSDATIQTAEYIRELEEAERGKKVSTVTALGSMTIKILASIVCLCAIGRYVFGGFVGSGGGDLSSLGAAGNYTLVELQEGNAFWDFYKFHDGKDSEGSNGYNMYVSREKAFALGIANVTLERIISTPDDDDPTKGRRNEEEEETESFIYMNSAPTEQGPRDSIRLEGRKRFDRGLFIIDLRHMPAGCGTWPAFWLTDAANWPVNGEIDIVEGVNYQDTAKTALHSTRGCHMNDVPDHVKTGTWDTAVGVPDKKTGTPDMTFRYATNCFVYYPHQWLNQGCVAVDLEGGSLGIPLNKKGGGVYALEWDPVNGYIRSWVFSPHGTVPTNLRDSMRTASADVEEERVVPNPDLWGLPYGYFAIGHGTDCPSTHFQNMRLVFNLAFCGSVSGNRYWLDCKNESKIYPTCNEYVKSNPKALEEAYWKIKGVYVYQRS
uniref:GH16 domain-containing protein n=2 Tax=Ditylum brightwellii TaxID=49249 RepID=A0A6V2DPC9_9STRA|mmetsp:Transcript_9516/g.13762  ORF Transcript_9516/g.13762 Transcript_9516/m.13762 type:complete len:508 (+) Transcript_9516:84-1607(+)